MPFEMPIDFDGNFFLNSGKRDENGNTGLYVEVRVMCYKKSQMKNC